MVRPLKDRYVAFNPHVSYFKPRGIPMVELEEVKLTVDEREALRLSDLLGLSHESAGRQMGVSRATFGRIIQRARKTIADALINGNYRIMDGPRVFSCDSCHHTWEEPRGTGRPPHCPDYRNEDIYRVAGEPADRKGPPEDFHRGRKA